MRSARRNVEKINYALFLPIFLLLLISVWVQYQAAVLDGNPVKSIVIKQLIFAIGMLCILFGSSLIPFRLFIKYAYWLYGLSLVPMMLLQFFYDPTMYQLTGTKRWLHLGPITWQPSELVKITFVLAVVLLTITLRQEKVRYTLKEDLIYMAKILLLALPTFLLMFLQRDFGTSIVFIWALMAIFVIAGVDWRILLTGFLGVALAASALLLFVFTKWGQEILYTLHFKEYQLDRVRAWIDPFAYKDTIAYQQVRSMLATSSGGVFGQSLDAQSIYVPVRESDMVFTVVAERFGYLGSCVVLFTYFYLFYQMIMTGLKTNQRASLYYCVGFIFILLFQVFENIGAAIGILPLTGIPLPFLSQGGTSLLTIGLGLGIILGMKPKQNN